MRPISSITASSACLGRRGDFFGVVFLFRLCDHGEHGPRILLQGNPHRFQLQAGVYLGGFRP